MNDYNIEFAHIYADAGFDEEQRESIKKLKEKTKFLRGNFSTVILIDEFSPKVKTLNEREFLKEISQEGANPDFIMYESNLENSAIKLLKEIPQEKVKKEKFKEGESILLITNNSKIGLITKDGKPSCALLIAAWILVRKGIYPFKELKKFSKKDFPAKKLITILPKKYEANERKVLEIIKSTKYSDVLKDVEYIFF